MIEKIRQRIAAAGLLLIATYEIGIYSVAHYGVNCKNN